MQLERPEWLSAWVEFAQAAALIEVGVNRALQRDAGLTLAENLVLCHVAMAPDGRVQLVQLSGALGIAKSAVTKTVDRLEERGWVTRSRDGADRRAVHAVLTPAGADAFRRAQPVFNAAVRDGLGDPLTADELARLRRILTKLIMANRPLS